MADDFYDPYAVFASGSGYGGRLYDDPAQFAAATTPMAQPGNDGGLLGRLFGMGRPQQYGGLMGQLTGGQQQPAQPGMTSAVSGFLGGKPAAPGGAGGTGGSNEELMNMLIRRQLEASMRPNWGKMAAAFAEAGKPSLLPTGGIGAAIGKAAGAMSDDDAGGTKTFQMLKLAQEIKNAQQLAKLREMTPAQIQELMKDVGGWASSGGGTSGGTTPGGGGGTGTGSDNRPGDQLISDPRNKIPVIRAAFEKYGHDPDIGIKVARSEGLSTFYGDGGKSGTAFQLYTGGGLGNEFQKETGLDPLDPKNEDAAIEWVAKNLGRTGWGPWNGAKKIGITGFKGIGGTKPDPATGVPQLAAVPNFSGALTGNQGPDYEPLPPPSAARPPSPAPAAPGAPAGPLAPPGAPAAPSPVAGGPALTKTRGGYVDGVYYRNIDEWNRAMDAQATQAYSRSKVQPTVPPPGGGSGGGIPPMTAAEAGGGGDDGGGGLIAGGQLGRIGGGPPPAPVPGLFLPKPNVSAPPPPPPPAPGQTPPMAPGGPPGGAMPSMVPQNIPMPNTQATQALLGKLAAMRAWSEMVGLGDVYKPFQDMVLNSPRYLIEKTQAEKGAAIPYQYLEPGANVGLQAQLSWVRAQSEQLAKYLGPEANAKLQGEIEEAKARGKAGVEAVQSAWQEWLKGQGGTPVEVTMNGPDGKPTKYKMTPNQFVQMQTGQVGPAVPPPGMFGPTPGAPAGAPAPGPAPAPAAPPLSPTGLTTGGGGGFTPGQQVGERVYDPGQKQEAEARGTSVVKREQEYRDAADLSRETKSSLLAVAADLDKVVHGPFAGAANTVQGYLRLIDPKFDTQVSSYENAQAEVNKLVRKAVRESDPNPTFLQTKMAIESMPSPLQSPGGAQKIANRMVGFANHNIARAAAMQQWLDTKGTINGFDADWRAKVSPFAFAYLQMDAADKQILAQHLARSPQGERERVRLAEQVKYIQQNGLEQ